MPQPKQATDSTELRILTRLLRFAENADWTHHVNDKGGQHFQTMAAGIKFKVGGSVHYGPWSWLPATMKASDIKELVLQIDAVVKEQWTQCQLKRLDEPFTLDFVPDQGQKS